MIKCKHYKGNGYAYKLHTEDLCLCKQCNLELAMGMMEQLAVQAFCSTPAHDKFQDLEINKLEKRLKECKKKTRS